MLILSLLALSAALASEEAEVRYEQGEPMSKTIFDLVEELPYLKKRLEIVRRYLSMAPPDRRSFEKVFLSTYTILGMRPENPQDATTFTALYSVAMAEPYRAIWRLDPEVWSALDGTTPPWDLLTERLPRLPFPAVLVRLPDGVQIDVRSQGAPPTEVRSILVVEEIPGRKWRYLGMNDEQKPEKLAVCRGWFDLGFASARAQIEEGKGIPDGGDYRDWGEDRIWRVLMNLFMVTEYEALVGQRVRPKFPRGSEGRHLQRTRSRDEYIVVHLSDRTREEIRQAEEVQDRGDRESPGAGRAPPAPHLVAGHWRSVWVLDPGNKPVWATKPRRNRAGEDVGGFLYRIATWVPPFWKGGGQPGQGKYLVKP